MSFAANVFGVFHPGVPGTWNNHLYKWLSQLDDSNFCTWKMVVSPNIPFKKNKKWMFPKIVGLVPPNHPIKKYVFSPWNFTPSILGGYFSTPIFGLETHKWVVAEFQAATTWWPTPKTHQASCSGEPMAGLLRWESARHREPESHVTHGCGKRWHEFYCPKKQGPQTKTYITVLQGGPLPVINEVI